MAVLLSTINIVLVRRSMDFPLSRNEHAVVVIDAELKDSTAAGI